MFSIFQAGWLAAVPVRDRVFVLLVVAIVLGASTSVVSIWALDRSGRVSQAAIRQELAVSQALGSVATRHLEQAAAVDAALRVASTRPADPTSLRAHRARFEHEAAAMWTALREIRGQVGSAGDPIAEVDRAHNAYAGHARAVFDSLEAGEVAAARVSVANLEAPQARFELALAQVLEQVRAHSEATIQRLDEQRREAIGWVVALTTLALLGGLAVLMRTIHLVTEMRSLEGLLPICARCKAIRDDRGYWNQIEAFVEAHSGAQFTHGLCEGCVGDMKAEVTRAREGNAQAPSSGPAASPRPAGS